LKILVIDDEPIVCERIKSSLEKFGIDVETFTESKSALKRITEEKFNIVVTDLKMKGLDGIEILRLVKEVNPECEVIIITGFATVEKAREALKIGAYDFIAKPFKLTQLRDLIFKAANKLERGAFS
jgi:DNA-binding NtrC family response regulator